VTKLLRVSALCLKFINVLKRKTVIKSSLTGEEIADAEQWWIKNIQHKAFSEIFSGSAKKSQGNLEKQSGLLLDTDGILRCKGR